MPSGMRPSVRCRPHQHHSVTNSRNAASDRASTFGWSGMPSWTLMYVRSSGIGPVPDLVYRRAQQRLPRLAHVRMALLAEVAVLQDRQRERDPAVQLVVLLRGVQPAVLHRLQVGVAFHVLLAGRLLVTAASGLSGTP